jgi:anti-sigma factor RsiW
VAKTVSTSCGRARRLLWPDAGPRGATEEVIAAREHAVACAACRAFLEDVRQLGQQIGRSAPRPSAPPEVRERLFKTIAQARTAAGPGRATRLRHVVAAGIASLLVIGLGWLVYLSVPTGPDGDHTLRLLVEDRLRSRRGAGLTSSDSLEVAQWLTERLPFAVQVPIFPQARLVGARVLVVDRKSGAVLEYSVRDVVLTYYVFPGEAAAGPRQIQVASRDGYRVASWHDGGLTHALVGTLPAPALIEYARYCMHQMMA